MEKTMSLSHQSVGSLLAYGNEVQQYILQYVDPTALDAEQYTAFTTAKREFEKGYHKKRKSDINLKKVDNRRDRAFLHLKHLILAGCYSPNEEVQQEAEKIKQLVERLGLTLYRKRYVVETADINKLLYQISEEHYKQATHRLNLQEAIDYLAKANADFFDSDFAATKERGEIKEIIAPTRVRKTYEYAIRGLWKYIDAQVIINQQPSWIHVKKTVELLNDKYSAELKRHYTFIRKKKEKGEGSTEEQPREAEGSSNTPDQV
jgi:hypothetical protein